MLRLDRMPASYRHYLDVPSLVTCCTPYYTCTQYTYPLLRPTARSLEYTSCFYPAGYEQMVRYDVLCNGNRTARDLILHTYIHINYLPTLLAKKSQAIRGQARFLAAAALRLVHHDHTHPHLRVDIISRSESGWHSKLTVRLGSAV